MKNVRNMSLLNSAIDRPTRVVEALHILYVRYNLPKHFRNKFAAVYNELNYPAICIFMRWLRNWRQPKGVLSHGRMVAQEGR